MNSIEMQKADMIRKYGPWTSDIKLKDGLYTLNKGLPFPQLKKIVQMIQDVSQCDFGKLRILDLACLEGQYAIEFALHGAEVVGIEGRESNVQKAIFAKNVLGLGNLSFYQDDVRNLSKQKYGEFDVVLCSGILYHLDAPDVFPFLESIHDVCRKFVIIDTHIASNPNVTVTYKNANYLGQTYREHDPQSSLNERLKANWASLDNVSSFWFTKASLFNYLTRIGFSSINESLSRYPAYQKKDDRITVLAFKRKPVIIQSLPVTNQLSEPEYQEF